MNLSATPAVIGYGKRYLEKKFFPATNIYKQSYCKTPSILSHLHAEHHKT